MRTFALTFVAVSLLAAFASAETETTTPLPIQGATVHPDRALVTRSGTVRLALGRQSIRVPALARTLDADSLRARIWFEGGAARVLSVDVQDQVLDQTDRPAVAKARADHEQARLTREAAELAVADAKRLRDGLLNLRATASDESTGFGAGPFTSTDRFLEARLPVARKALVDAELALQQAQEAERAALLVRKQLESAAETSRRTALVTIESQTAGSATLELRYLAGGASWRPLYEVRVDDALAGARMELVAEVAQRTGEDWTDVPLTFTTAQPSLGASPPTRTTWVVDRRRPAPTASRPAPAKAELQESLRRMERRRSNDKKQLDELLDDAPRMRTGGALVAFESARPESLASGSGNRRLTLAAFDLAPEVLWTAFPRETKHVFATARLRNTTGVLLPGGQARVFVGPDLVGDQWFDDWAPEEQRDLGLGVDRMVTAEREELVRTRSEEGFFSSKIVHKRAYRLTVTNHREREILVRLLDQIPVSADDALEVEVTSNSHRLADLPARDAETNAANGVLVWRFRMFAGGRYPVTFEYTATHPDDRTPYGLEEDR